MSDELKMWLAVRTDIQMTKGKLAAQSGHAFQMAIVDALMRDADKAKRYLSGSMTKIIVKADDEKHLEDIHSIALSSGLTSALIRDEGRTEFNSPTLTVCAFGPELRDSLPSELKRLRLL